MVIWDEEPQGVVTGTDRRLQAKRNFDAAARRVAERERLMREPKRPIGPVDEMEEESTRG